MQDERVPSWCHWHVGTRPVLFIAPHGGRCYSSDGASGGRPLKVNDVHTADLTTRLAAQLDASFIVNAGLDRNELDLNRISQVRSRAPWFILLLERMIETLIRRHAAAEVVFIHGWNVIQPKCDIGVGAHLPDAGAATHLRKHLTVSPHYVAHRLERLRAHCAGVGVRTSYGERYPASHPNNLLQLFRRAEAEEGGLWGPLSHLTAAGRIEAVQLELGVPLRWDGHWRDAFIAAAARAFDDDQAVVQADQAPESDQSTLLTPASLMFYDPTSQLGVISGIAGTPAGGVGGRLVLFCAGRTVALFTGEDRGTNAVLFGGPVFRLHPPGFDLSFEGPVLEVDDGARYVHLEDAFHHSRLIDVRVALSFRGGDVHEYGAVTGTIEIDGRTHRINTYGFTAMPLLQRAAAARTRTVVVAAVQPQLGVVVTAGTDSAGSVTYFSPDGQRTASCPASPAADQDEPLRFLVADDRGDAVIAEPLSRMRIRRPLGGGEHQVITLGVARMRLSGHQPCFGFYEHSRRVRVGAALKNAPAVAP